MSERPTFGDIYKYQSAVPRDSLQGLKQLYEGRFTQSGNAEALRTSPISLPDILMLYEELSIVNKSC